MKAALIHTFEGIQSIKFEEVSIPVPQEGEVQIALKYAAINPVDWKIAEGHFKSRMPYFLPIILGWDAAGEITAVHASVKNFKVGDPVYVYCKKEFLRDGSFAEYICLDAQKNVALKPTTLNYNTAASVPLSSLTAWQVLHEEAELKSREKILIHAGSGAVGGFAIQFAKLIGAHVITTASAKNFDYVKKLGADELIDYKSENFKEVILKKYPEGVDVAFDTIGGETLKQSYAATKEEGRLITIVEAPHEDLAARRHIFTKRFLVHPDGKDLEKIAKLIDSGKVIPPRIQEIPFSDLISGITQVKSGQAQAKIVVKIGS